MANNNLARNNAKKTLYGRYVPRQEDFFAANAKAANDNQPNKNNNSETKPSDGDENLKNLKNVGGVFVNEKRPESERGNKPVVENPAFPKEAEGTIGEETKKLLENPNYKKIQLSAANDNQSDFQTEQAENDNESFEDGELERLQNQKTLELEASFKKQNSYEKIKRNTELINVAIIELRREKVEVSVGEVQDLLGSNFHVKFPWTMFIVSALIEFILLVAEAVTIILVFILMPIGLAGEASLTLISSIMSALIIFVWSNNYAKNASDFTKKIPLFKKFLVRFLFKRGWLLLAKMIPFLGRFLPITTFMIYMTYREVLKTAKKVKIIIDKLNSKLIN